jgi:hypothetical protein
VRSGLIHVLAGDVADAMQQLATGATLTLEPTCVALLLGARGQAMWVTFDDSTPSTTNGLAVIAGAQPAYIPLGYHAHASHNVKTVQSAATGFLDVVQLG